MEQEIENVLRAAPRPMPPAGLKERLIAQVRLPAVQPASQPLASPLAPAGWLRRWWPVLAPAAVSLACAVGLTLQQMEIRDLKQAIQDLSRDSAAKPSVLPPPTLGTNNAPAGADAAARTQQEIARLKALASQLATEVAQLEQMRAENTKLRTQLEAPPAGILTPEETDALAKAKERAERIACINNLKQLGLAARVWAIDNGNMTPPNILDMTNEMSTPKILACPGDHAREAAKGWASYTSANCSYEYLAPSAPYEDPARVMFRCPIHGHVGLVDGSVQAIAKDHPERLVQINGKLYFATSPQPAQGGPAPPSGNPPPGGSNP
jgi:FtsZ-binding cell division protein ZapB